MKSHIFNAPCSVVAPGRVIWQTLPRLILVAAFNTSLAVFLATVLSASAPMAWAQAGSTPAVGIYFHRDAQGALTPISLTVDNLSEEGGYSDITLLLPGPTEIVARFHSDNGVTVGGVADPHLTRWEQNQSGTQITIWYDGVAILFTRFQQEADQVGSGAIQAIAEGIASIELGGPVGPVFLDTPYGVVPGPSFVWCSVDLGRPVLDELNRCAGIEAQGGGCPESAGCRMTTNGLGCVGALYANCSDIIRASGQCNAIGPMTLFGDDHRGPIFSCTVPSFDEAITLGGVGGVAGAYQLLEVLVEEGPLSPNHPQYIPRTELQ